MTSTLKRVVVLKGTKNELNAILKASRKINVILSDRTFSRWDIGRFITNFKGRVMISSSRWEAWHVCRLAEQHALIFVDGTRFGYWDLQKIITAGGYVLIDDRHISTPQLIRLSDSAPSKVVVINHNLNDDNTTLLQGKGTAVFSEGKISRIEISAKKIRHTKVEEIEEQQPSVEKKKPINWLEGVSLW